MTGRMERVKLALRTHAEICSLSDLYGAALSNGRNDVSTLRRRGWIIHVEWANHGNIAHCHYTLIEEREPAPHRPATQLRLQGVR